MTQLTTKLVNVTYDAGLGKLVCSPNPVIVDTPNTLIVYDLQTTGYAFPETGAIVVTAPGTQFPYAAWVPSASCAALLDLKTANGDFHYTASAVHLASGETLSIDPTIRNQN